MEENYFTKQGRYRVAEIKYFDNYKIFTENFGYQSISEFAKKLHKFYEKFVGMEKFLWVEVIFWNTKGHKKFYQFQSIFEFYALYTGILVAGELI